MKMFNKINIAGLYGFWLAFLLNLVMPFPGSWNPGVLYVGLALLAIHFLEFIVMFTKLKAVNHTSAKDFVLVMLVGLFHWMPLIRKST